MAAPLSTGEISFFTFCLSRSSITQKQGYGEMFNVEMTLMGSWKNKLVPKAPCLILAARKGRRGKCRGWWGRRCPVGVARACGERIWQCHGYQLRSWSPGRCGELPSHLEAQHSLNVSGEIPATQRYGFVRSPGPTRVCQLLGVRRWGDLCTRSLGSCMALCS